MKIYKKIALALCVVIATSCTLDLREDPNAVQPSQVLPTLMLNSLQRSLAGLFNNASGTGMALTRQINAGSSLYRTTITPEGLNGFWSTAYANILQDVDQLLVLSVPDKSKPNERYARHMGIARIIQAYTLVTLVDSFGDVPFSQAFKGDGNFNPGVDSQADLYAKAIVMLDSAKLDLTTRLTTANPPGYLSPIAPDLNDLYYGTGAAAPSTDPAVKEAQLAASYTKWIKLANSLKLKIYLNLRLTDQPGAQAAIAAMVADASSTGGFITSQDENFVFRYGTTTADPDARHPRFVGQYPAGGGDYQSNWLMWHMLYGYDFKHRFQDLGDPRTRFYFYRQVTANSTSTNDIRCLGESLPSHYPGSTGSAIIDNSIAGRPPMGVDPLHPTNDPTDPAWNRTFCYVSDRGYWGRDHVDPQGIPPDGLLRTAYGVYPVGGRFDNNAGTGVAASQGQRGAGMEPIMMRSFVSFMLAEASLYMAIGGPGAAAHFSNGVSTSLADVRAWAVAGTFGSTSVAATTGETATINGFYPLTYPGTLASGGAVVATTTGNLVALSGTLTVDGVALVAGNRVLVKNQTTGSQNGIYDVAVGAWTRSTDSDTPAELLNQAVTVTGGTVNAGTRWHQTAAPTAGIVVGTTSLTYGIGSSWNVDAAAYLALANASFLNRLGVSADEAMNYVAREYWIALFGNGVESINLYRRTGMPTGMQPVVSPTPGAFPRSYWYPANFANLNNTVDQKADVNLRVFWDTNTTNLDF